MPAMPIDIGTAADLFTALGKGPLEHAFGDAHTGIASRAALLARSAQSIEEMARRIAPDIDVLADRAPGDHASGAGSVQLARLHRATGEGSRALAARVAARAESAGGLGDAAKPPECGFAFRAVVSL